MAKTLDDMKMVHEEEMQNYDRIQEAVTRVMHRHGCKIIQTPAFEEYDTYSRLFPQLKREMVKTIDTDGQVLVMRPDVTVPLVRTVAREYPDPHQLLKFGYVSTVFCEFFGKSTHGKYFTQSGGGKCWGILRRNVTAKSLSWRWNFWNRWELRMCVLIWVMYPTCMRCFAAWDCGTKNWHL